MRAQSRKVDSSTARMDQIGVGGMAAADQNDMDKLYEGVVNRFKHHDRRLFIHRETSEHFLRGIRPGELDWVYIGGNHSEETVRKDLISSCRHLTVHE